jgi:hypothetical protein
MNVDLDECNCPGVQRLVETLSALTGVDNEKAASLTAEDVEVAEKMIKDRQGIGWGRGCVESGSLLRGARACALLARRSA